MEHNKIKAYFLRVDKDLRLPYQGYLGEIENTLSAKQKYVNFGKANGSIQVVSLTDEIDIICHDEGKLLGFPANRAWLDNEGEVLDLLVGNLLVVRCEGPDFTSIRESDIPYIEEYLKPVRVMDEVLVPIPPEILPKCNGGS